MTDTAARYLSVVARIEEAARAANRNPSEVQLVAVSKTFEANAILPVIELGQRVFGENRVQEAARKWQELKRRYGDLELHLVGPLQSNKVRDAVGLFDVIETVDRPKIAEALAGEISRQGRTPVLLVQVNTGEEPQKAGIAPEQTAEFVTLCTREYGLKISGLMCIPPFEENPGPHFALLAKLAAECGLGILSMGMSADFETAISFGATHVRIGSAIFGER